MKGFIGGYTRCKKQVSYTKSGLTAPFLLEIRQKTPRQTAEGLLTVDDRSSGSIYPNLNVTNLN